MNTKILAVQKEVGALYFKTGYFHKIQILNGKTHDQKENSSTFLKHMQYQVTNISSSLFEDHSEPIFYLHKLKDDFLF